MLPLALNLKGFPCFFTMFLVPKEQQQSWQQPDIYLLKALGLTVYHCTDWKQTGRDEGYKGRWGKNPNRFPGKIEMSFFFQSAAGQQRDFRSEFAQCLHKKGEHSPWTTLFWEKLGAQTKFSVSEYLSTNVINEILTHPTCINYIYPLLNISNSKSLRVVLVTSRLQYLCLE